MIFAVAVKILGSGLRLVSWPLASFNGDEAGGLSGQILGDLLLGVRFQSYLRHSFLLNVFQPGLDFVCR